MSLIPNGNASNAWQNFEVDVSEQELPNLEAYQNAGVYIYGICLILIPTATLLGNLLVIVSVLRFRALHSSINFLILGLAVADLFVALFVMPYAVYVYMQGGFWFLGPLMCDIYSATDVACSTASILLLAVISFDRYRAVSRPIQYSRQSQNIRRVIFILLAIWLISLALASPIVLGMNDRPDDASPYECRLYNPEFSILSSMVSFVIPCFVVLFVYIRIMIALRKREKAARLRRMNASQYNGDAKDDDHEQDEVGEIVAGPAVNVMMLALPSMTKRIRRYEKHKAAVEQAGDDNIEIGIDDEIDEDDEDIDHDVYNGSDADLLGTTDGSVVESNPRSKPRRKVTQRQRKVTQGIAIISPQALSLTSFLPILGAAAATVGTPSVNLDEEEPPSPKYRKRKSTRSNTVTHVPHVISRPHSALPPTPQQHDFFFYPTTSDSHLPLSDRNQQYLQNREHIWNTRAKFFRSTSGPALLDAKSPLMLRRFVLDPENDPEPKDLSERTVDFQDYQEPSFLRSRSSSIHSLPNENDLGGSSTPRSSSDSLSENLNVITNDFISEGPNSVSRRSSDIDFPLSKNMILTVNSSGVQNYKSIERSQNYTAHKKKQRKMTSSLRRRSLTMPSVDSSAKEHHVIPSILRHFSKRSPRIFRNGQVGSANECDKQANDLLTKNDINHFNNYALNKKSESMRIMKQTPTIFENPSATLLSVRKLTPDSLPTFNETKNKHEELTNLLPTNKNMTTTTAALLTTTLSRSKSDRGQKPSLCSRTLSTGTIKRPTKGIENCSSPLLTYSNAETSIMRNEHESTTHTTQTTLEDEITPSELATTAASTKLGFIIPNEPAIASLEDYHKQKVQSKIENSPKDEAHSPTVTFNISGKALSGGTRTKDGNGYVNSVERRRSSGVELFYDNKPSGSSAGFPSSISSNIMSSETDSAYARIIAQKPRPKKSISHNTFDIQESHFLHNNTLGDDSNVIRKVTNPRLNGGPSAALAVKLAKRTVNRKDGSSLKRKVTKAQRKEKRATKTLGIVVGVFLICWVPFFTINILNGICIRFNIESCQVGFDIFFYATWVGYMNSFMNPVIYTIFNTEFRRAFKSLILGRNAVRRHRARHV